MNLFGEELRIIREGKNLPLRKVAAFLDVDTSIVSKIERGERQPTREMVIKICDFFELNKDEKLREFLGEQVAKTIYREKDVDEILKVAEEKVKYLKSKSTTQGKLKY